MQKAEVCLQPGTTGSYSISSFHEKATAGRDEATLSTLSPAIKQSEIKSKPLLTLVSSKSDSLQHFFLQKLPLSKEISFDDVQAQTKHYITLIEDPLWRYICTEVVKIMGDTVISKIWNMWLGNLSSQSKSIDIYCPTEEAADFLYQYPFVIIGCFQKYFPAISDLRIKSSESSEVRARA